MGVELHLGDCLDVMRGMADNSVNLIVTDPPYYKVKGEAWDRQWDSPEGFLSWVRDLCAEGPAVELDVPASAYTYVDLYHTTGGPVAHVVHYGDGEPEGYRLRVAPWIAAGPAILYSPYMDSPTEMRPDAGGWLDLPPDFGRYCAVAFAR